MNVELASGADALQQGLSAPRLGYHSVTASLTVGLAPVPCIGYGLQAEHRLT